MKFTQYNRNKDKAGKIYLNPRSLITKSLVRKMEQNCDKPLKWTQSIDDLQTLTKYLDHTHPRFRPVAIHTWFSTNG